MYQIMKTQISIVYSPNLSYQQIGTRMRPSSLCVQQAAAAEKNLDRKSNEDDSWSGGAHTQVPSWR